MRWLIPLAALASIAAAAPHALTPLEAIAAADRAGLDGTPGRFEMKVVAADKVRHVTALYSAPDPLAPTTLTISLSKPAVSQFKKKYGAPPEQYLRGRIVTVDGAVRAVTVGTDRKQTVHEVWVYELSQLAAIN